MVEDRRPRPAGRLLVVTQKSPFPPDSGSKQRTWLLLKALLSIAPVDVAVIGGGRPEGSADYVDGVHIHWLGLRPSAGRVPRMLNRFGELLRPFRKSDQLTAALAALLKRGEHRAAIFRYLPIFARVRGACEALPTLVDVDDLDTQKLRSEAGNPHQTPVRRAWAALQLALVAREMRRVARSAAALTFCTLEDAQEMGLPDFEIIPNIPYHLAQGLAPTFTPSAVNAATIKFLGRLSWSVNIRGLDGFLTHAWPQILRKFPLARFEIGGSDLGEAERRRWASIPGVTVVGFVADVDGFYRDAALTICPVFEGGGTKIKVIESLWHGRAVVLSPHSLRGHEDLLGAHRGVAVAEDWSGLAHACVQLLSDPGARHRLEAEGHRTVVSALSWENYTETVRRALGRAEGKMWSDR